MTPAAWFTLSVVAGVFGLLMWAPITPGMSLLAGLGVLLITPGIVEPAAALAGFSNEGMMTVAVLFVVAAGVRETGGIDWLAERLLGRSKNIDWTLIRLVAPTTALSAVLNNTPLVAMLIPAVADWCKKHRVAASKLMIPLSYAAILGGTCTLIGTSTNLVVNGMLIAREGYGLPVFEITKVGLPAAIVGCLFLLVTHRWLLPDRAPVLAQLDDPRQYTVEMTVEPDSPLIGKTIEEAGLRHLQGVYLAEIDREGRVLAAVSPHEPLYANDRLVFVGVVDSVVDLRRIRGLQPATDQVFKLTAPRTTRCMIEAVVSDSSPLVGRTIRDARFRSNYNAVVVAVARNGERMHRKIGDIIVRPGDTLLLEGHADFVKQHRNSRHFFLVSQLEDSQPPRHDRALLALVILVGMVILAATGLLSMFKAALVAATLMMLTRCVSLHGARRSLDADVLLAIAAAFGLGAALEQSGAALSIAQGLIDLAAGRPWLSLAVVYGITLVVTELITNNAAAALMFPLAMATAERLGVSNMPFIIVVMMAASAGFATPIGYQTNLMVYGPGGYRFSDFVKIGVPLDLLVWAVTVALAPLIWPFH